MKRRTFLKIAAMGSLSFVSACSPDSEKKLFSLVAAPEDMITGKATWYASTCRECPAGCGVLAKNREGRIVKLEGNPLHPINRGRLCMRGQAALQGIYNPDRLKNPLIKDNGQWRTISFPQAVTLIKAKAITAAHKGPDRVRMLTETIGAGMMRLCTAAMQNLESRPPLVFETYAYESLKTANKIAFGVDGLPSYHLDRADVLVSFGADFLETWLSPVEYARKFKQMHAVQRDGRKNIFFHVNACQAMTGANADHWLACKPESEADIALGLVKEALDNGKGQDLPSSLHQFLKAITTSYTRELVADRTGIAPKVLSRLSNRLLNAQAPLVLGTGTGASNKNGLKTNLAANLLNLLLDPELRLLDFSNRHRVEAAARRVDIFRYFDSLHNGEADLLLLNNVNPVYGLPAAGRTKEALEQKSLFAVCFSNFMDETASAADLVIPFKMPLETWDEYGGKLPLISTLQPAMGQLTKAPQLGDLMLDIGFAGRSPAAGYKDYLVAELAKDGGITDEIQWVQTLQQGGKFDQAVAAPATTKIPREIDLADILIPPLEKPTSDLTLMATPSIRFFDGRGANRPWLCEIPDPLSRVAWQTTVIVHPATAAAKGFAQEDIVTLATEFGSLEATVYVTELVAPGLLSISIGQGHRFYGRYAAETGANPLQLLSTATDPISGGTSFGISARAVTKTGRVQKLASTSGSRIQHGRTMALSVELAALQNNRLPQKAGLTMDDFPLTLPLPEGYDPHRDVYPPHEHDTYRWGMVVDLDRCIGCGACAAACYAENNLGIVGVERVLEGREMGWMSIERYHTADALEKVTFLPMMCQHCDNAPCESVCPVYAPHHSKEGLNNQIYNRCIGTRYCVQNCPYKVRRFNWFTWEWPEPMNLQLNPDVTVRSKGVMEKCSFCVQRIKDAHNQAKNEKRMIRDGEVMPACVQTCPTEALFFGNLMDKASRVRKLVDDPRAYQVLGYLNTKPAVIYLKKVVQGI
jgi:molybdopterin-containing oxidoreductase family iron-sulfur binding subunit